MIPNDDLAGDAYYLPSLDLLTQRSALHSIDKAVLEDQARQLESALHEYGIAAKVVEVRPGPVVNLFELKPAPGVKTSRVVALADDIARTMSALSARITVVPGRNLIGVELPNGKRESVSLRELIASQTFEDQAGLPVVLGKDISGAPIVTDLTSMPHLLMAGTTGSGKSVALNSMILSLLYRLTPDQCRLIMIDPKMLELSVYDDIPHLLFPIVTDPAKAVQALSWTVEEMEDRYRKMSWVGVRGLASFNDKVRVAKGKGQKLTRRVQTAYDAERRLPLYEEEALDFDPLPQIVIIIDEFADLMTSGKEVEFLIQRLAQKARAAGIYLIMATQHPSSEVVTSTIKASLPARIAFRVMNHYASRTVLGVAGAEQLLGHGDMLVVLPGELPLRVHGAFTTDRDCEAVAEHWRSQEAASYIVPITGEVGAPTSNEVAEVQYLTATKLVLESGKASTSWLQRQLRTSYNSAGGLIERMEKEGIVSRPDHVGRREVLSVKLPPLVLPPPRRGWWQRTFGS